MSPRTNNEKHKLGITGAGDPGPTDRVYVCFGCEHLLNPSLKVSRGPENKALVRRKEASTRPFPII